MIILEIIAGIAIFMFAALIAILISVRRLNCKFLKDGYPPEEV